MKKLMTFLTVCLIVNVSFAQNQNVKPFDTKASPGKLKYNYMQLRAQGEGYSYPFTSLPGFPIANDSTTLVGGKGLDVLHAGQFYDLSHRYYIESLEYGAPNLAELITNDSTFSYKLDSVIIPLAYFRVNSDEDVVDTLIVMVAKPLFSLMGYGEPTILAYPSVGFDTTTKLPKNYEIFKFPLTVNDTALISEEELYYTNFRFPLNLEMSSTKFAVFYTFKRHETGSEENVEYSDVNHILHKHYTDPSGYNYNAPNPEFKGSNLNYGLFLTKEAYYNYGLEGGLTDRQYTPSIFWEKWHYVNLTIILSCNNCSTVGVQEQDVKNVSVYPNPANNTVNVQLANAAPAKIELINLVGQTVISQNASTEEVRLDISSLNKGIYMVRVAQEGKVYTSKLVVK